MKKEDQEPQESTEPKELDSSDDDMGGPDLSKILKDPGNLDRLEQFEDWWRLCQLYIGQQKIDDDLKISAVLSRLMTGPGKEWAIAMYEKGDEMTWTTFKTLIETKFTITNKAAKQRKRLHAYRQEGLKIDLFLDKFDRLKRDVKLDNSSAKFFLEAALDEKISERINADDHDTYEKYYEAALQEGKRQESHKAVTSFTGREDRNKIKKVAEEPPRVKVKKCSKCGRNNHEDKDCRAKSKIKCFNCGGLGHVSTECKQAPKRKDKNRRKFAKTKKISAQESDDETDSETDFQ